MLEGVLYIVYHLPWHGKGNWSQWPNTLASLYLIYRPLPDSMPQKIRLVTIARLLLKIWCMHWLGALMLIFFGGQRRRSWTLSSQGSVRIHGQRIYSWEKIIVEHDRAVIITLEKILKLYLILDSRNTTFHGKVSCNSQLALELIRIWCHL
jgi:hypothetical protein